jgi:hypothetical protein
VAVGDVAVRFAPETVYNLRVTGNHTYYVLAGDTFVLVHNAGGYSEPVQNLIDAMSHGVNSANPIGDGTALAAASHQVQTGELVEGVDHVKSTQQYKNRLVKMRDGVPIGPTRRTAQVIPLTDVDRQGVHGLIKAIDDAHAGQYTKLTDYGIRGCA